MCDAGTVQLKRDVGNHPCNDPRISTSYDQGNPNYHKYVNPPTVICRKNESAICTVDKVFELMLETPSAIAPVSPQRQVIISCGELSLMTFPVNLAGYDNRIKIVIDKAQHSVTNYTLPGHMFYPGQVVRHVVELNNAVQIETTGEGTGDFRWFNLFFGAELVWPGADDALRLKFLSGTLR